MRKKIVLLMITTLLLVVSASAADKKFTLVIDAGHGGKDTGAMGSETNEKTLTLRMALAFGRLVEQNCPDVKVVYTRKTDRFVELYRRAEIANQNKADLFISVHINALPKGHIARGFQTYTLGRSRRTGKKTGVMENLEVAKRENAVIFLEKDYKQTYHGYDPNSPESNIMFEFIQDKNMENSVELAKYMQRYVCQATGRQNMGAHQDNLAVLRLTSMPGCLIELGFISTRDEEQYMNSSAATSAYARGIYNAFAAYKKKHGGQISVPYLPESKSEKVEIPQIVPKQSAKRKQEEAEQQDCPDKQPELHTPPLPQQEERLTQTSVPQKPQQSDNEISVAKEREQPTEEIPITDVAVFKIQILASASMLKPNDSHLKGLADVEYFKEDGMYKYTVGASSDYNKIYRLRKEILGKFPQAFIIAFKQGQKTDIQQAIREFRNRKR